MRTTKQSAYKIMRTELSEVLNRRFVHSKIPIILILEKIFTFNSLNESKYKKLLWLFNIRVITKLRTPNNLTKGKSKLISIQTDKISQQPENCDNVMTLTWYRHF
jgi:hypothetical protein